MAGTPFENPFVYGEVVPVTAFVDREVELARLTADLADGQKVFLISPRRYGKSSLVRHALTALARRDVATLEVTVASYSSYLAFLEGYAGAVVAAETRADRAKRWLADAIRSFPAQIRHDPRRPGGPLAVAFPGARRDRDVARLAAEVFALPGRLARSRAGRVAVALDEFQAIGSFDGGSVEHALRAAVQQQRDVGYVFAGSEPTLMERMLGPRRPFYKAGPVMRLQKIPADAFAAFIEHRFVESGVSCEPDMGTALVELAGNLPYDVQRLAHEVWDDARAAGREHVALEDLHATLRRLLAEQALLFETVWQRLTLAQRATLRAVVVEDGREMLSADVRARHRLGGASSVQASLAALLRGDVVAREDARYSVVDSLLREWVARRTY